MQRCASGIAGQRRQSLLSILCSLFCPSCSLVARPCTLPTQHVLILRGKNMHDPRLVTMGAYHDLHERLSLPFRSFSLSLLDLLSFSVSNACYVFLSFASGFIPAFGNGRLGFVHEKWALSLEYLALHAPSTAVFCHGHATAFMGCGYANGGLGTRTVHGAWSIWE